MVLRALDRFQSEHGGVPGECHIEADTARIKSIANKLLADWGVTHPFSDELAHEICRYGGSEIHSVSAFMGEFEYSEDNTTLFSVFFTFGICLCYRWMCGSGSHQNDHPAVSTG